MKIYILKNDNSSFERYFLHRMQHCLPGVEVLSVYRCTNTMLGDYFITFTNIPEPKNDPAVRKSLPQIL